MKSFLLILLIMSCSPMFISDEKLNTVWIGKDYNEIITFLSSQVSKFFISLFLIFAYFFSALSISEVFEDYIHDEKIKNAANKTLNFFAILLPLFTIIVLLNLSL